MRPTTFNSSFWVVNLELMSIHLSIQIDGNDVLMEGSNANKIIRRPTKEYFRS